MCVAMVTLMLAVSAAALQGPAKTQPRSSGSQVVTPAYSAAGKPAAATPKSDDLAWLQDALKNPDLMNEVNHLSERLTKEVQYPALRTQSAVLPRLGQNTVFYVALPNMGPQLRQSLEIYRQELQGSAALRDFLRKNHLDASEPKFEDTIAKFGDFLDYLGDEMVLTGGLNGKEPNGVLIAEIRKPGLKEFLAKVDQELNATSPEHVRLFDPQQLEGAIDHPGQEPVVLIRPDFVVIGTSTATLRAVNAQLDRGGASFASSPLGKRLAQSYQSGTNSAFGVDIQRLLALIPDNQPQVRMILDKTGLGDASYAMMEGRMSNGRSDAKMELAFSGTRRGVASWITTPAPLGALDFMSPKSSIAEVFRLKNFARLFDDIGEIAGPSAFATLPQMEAQMNINLKQDILSKFTGEVGFEMPTLPIPTADQAANPAALQPSFKFILGVSDPAGLQQTMKRLLAQAPLQGSEWQADGVTVSTLSTPSPNGKSTDINYFFMDNYLVITTSRALAQEAVHVHRSGESLAKSSQVTAAAGHPAKASVLVYQNSGPFIATMLKQLPAQFVGQLPQSLLAGEATPNVLVGTADDRTLRATSSNSITTDASVGLIIAAVAIPNLLRSRHTANEAAAAATVRTVNTAEITYRTSYPRKGYSPTLAAMGPGTTSNCTEKDISAAHACLLDSVVGNANCTAGKWCEKSGYRFSVRGVCLQTSCRGYVVTATPISEATGAKSFCSTTDGVVRSHNGPPLTAPLTPAECKAWSPGM